MSHKTDQLTKARMRDGRCLLCLYSKKAGRLDQVYSPDVISIHHIKTRGAGGTDDLDNLICLCHRHHMEVHSGKYSKEELRALIGESGELQRRRPRLEDISQDR